MYVVRYRTTIVARNLLIAFPEKPREERQQIRKDFYRNLTDNMLETLKLISMSEKTFMKRAVIDMHEVDPVIARGLNVQFHSGHLMNWEYASLSVSRMLTIPWLAVYMRVSAKFANRLMLKIRSKFGAVMVSKDKFRTAMPSLMRKQYALGLIADQNPAHVKEGYWLNFFNRPAPFIFGPEKGAVRNKTAVVFVRILKIKRGYYRFECKLITEDGSKSAPGDLTRQYRDFLENEIRKQPANYLWSHRRWKREWNPAYIRKWVDTAPAPKD